MNVLETVLEFKGYPIKVSKGRVFLQAFGTTIYNHSMHHSWQEVELSSLRSDVRDFLNSSGVL